MNVPSDILEDPTTETIYVMRRKSTQRKGKR